MGLGVGMVLLLVSPSPESRPQISSWGKESSSGSLVPSMYMAPATVVPR